MVAKHFQYSLLEQSGKLEIWSMYHGQLQLIMVEVINIDFVQNLKIWRKNVSRKCRSSLWVCKVLFGEMELKYFLKVLMFQRELYLLDQLGLWILFQEMIQVALERVFLQGKQILFSYSKNLTLIEPDHLLFYQSININ